MVCGRGDRCGEMRWQTGRVGDLYPLSAGGRCFLHGVVCGVCVVCRELASPGVACCRFSASFRRREWDGPCTPARHGVGAPCRDRQAAAAVHWDRSAQKNYTPGRAQTIGGSTNNASKHAPPARPSTPDHRIGGNTWATIRLCADQRSRRVTSIASTRVPYREHDGGKSDGQRVIQKPVSVQLVASTATTITLAALQKNELRGWTGAFPRAGYCRRAPFRFDIAHP